MFPPYQMVIDPLYLIFLESQTPSQGTSTNSSNSSNTLFSLREFEEKEGKDLDGYHFLFLMPIFEGDEFGRKRFKGINGSSRILELFEG